MQSNPNSRLLRACSSQRNPSNCLSQTYIYRVDAELTMSAKSARRTQKVSRFTFNSVVGNSLDIDFLPHTVSEPPASLTIMWPISICCRRERTALRDKLTRGPQATDPICARTPSSAVVMREVMPTSAKSNKAVANAGGPHAAARPSKLQRTRTSTKRNGKQCLRRSARYRMNI